MAEIDFNIDLCELEEYLKGLSLGMKFEEKTRYIIENNLKNSLGRDWIIVTKESKDEHLKFEVYIKPILRIT